VKKTKTHASPAIWTSHPGFIFGCSPPCNFCKAVIIVRVREPTICFDVGCQSVTKSINNDPVEAAVREL